MKHQHGGDIYNHQNILDFSANINPLGTPKAVIDAACAGVKASSFYPDPYVRELRCAIAEKEGVAPSAVICGNGAAELIFSLCFALKPKKALLLAPTFFEYEQALTAAGCEIQRYHLKEENDFAVDEGYLDAITEDIDIVFLCNPNNPTGMLTNKTILKNVLDLTALHHITFITDECFNDFIEEPEAYSIKEYLTEYRQLFILKAFTKIYAMAGLRLGYGLCYNEELLSKMHEVSQPWSVSIPAQKAGLAALKEEEFIKETMTLIKKERQFLYEALSALGLKVFPGKANYLFFKAEEFLDKACLERGVMIRDCSNYPGLSPGYFRIAVKNHKLNLILVDTLRTCLKIDHREGRKANESKDNEQQRIKKP